MGNIIFLSAEILFLGAVIYIAPFFSTILITIFSLGILYFIFGRKEILYYLLPVLFLARIFFIINFENFNEINSDKIFKIETKIVNGKGVVKKADDKYPLKTINIETFKISDGKYILYGNFKQKKSGFNYFDIETIKKEELPLNRFEMFFNSRLDKMKKYLSNKCENFLNGVILGERRYIYRNVREKFIYSGSAHLLAISGLHIGAVIGIILSAVNIFNLKREIKYFSAWFFLSIYIAGINGSPSVIRAYIMGSIFLLGKIIYEKTDLKKSFAAAVIINLFLYPNSLGNISFIFSYLCLFTIIYIYPKISIKKDIKIKNILNFLIFTGTIQIFIIPVQLYFFGTFPLLSYFTNFFLTPAGMIFVTLGFINFFIPEIIFRFIFAPVLEAVYKIMEIMLNFFADIPYLTIKSDSKLSLKFIIFIYIILTVLFYGKDIYLLLKDRYIKESR